MTMFKKYISEVVYGSMDGTITTFAIISAVAGANLSPIVVVILGLSNVLADGFSMSSSDYLAIKSKRSVTNSHDTKSAFSSAVVTYFSFIIIGLIPVVPYILYYIFPIVRGSEYTLSMLATAFAFVIIGLMRAEIAGSSIFKTLLETFIIGFLAALIAYYAGFFVSSLVGNLNII